MICDNVTHAPAASTHGHPLHEARDNPKRGQKHPQQPRGHTRKELSCGACSIAVRLENTKIIAVTPGSGCQHMSCSHAGKGVAPVSEANSTTINNDADCLTERTAFGRPTPRFLEPDPNDRSESIHEAMLELSGKHLGSIPVRAHGCFLEACRATAREAFREGHSVSAEGHTGRICATLTT